MDIFSLRENLISRLGIQSLPEKERLEILEKAADLVLSRVVLRMMERLSAEDAAEANRLADKPEELIAFLESKVGNMPALIAEETEAVKADLIKSAETALQA